MLQLISHADDLGLHPEVTAGIHQAVTAGGLSELSVIVTPPSSQAIVTDPTIPASLPRGLHLNLTEGRPISDPTTIASLVSRTGQFLGLTGFLLKLWTGGVRADQMARELRAQVATYSDWFGHLPPHLDSHHHIHCYHPVRETVRTIADERAIPTVRLAKRLMLPPLAPLRARLIAHATSRLSCTGWSDRPMLTGLIDPRWLPQPTLAGTFRCLPPGTYECIWHLTDGPSFPWRAPQLPMLEACPWKELETTNVLTLTTYDALWQASLASRPQ
ncbi:ChbG/HpnK family deacetylase [Candidatus Berkelbacteria bacterium]|nr:ChbG/HpnK family deacetylase [Candidatus Berkelbacteria bacterium]